MFPFNQRELLQFHSDVLISLMGRTNYRNWQKLKQYMECASEKEFIHWLLELGYEQVPLPHRTMLLHQDRIHTSKSPAHTAAAPRVTRIKTESDSAATVRNNLYCAKPTASSHDHREVQDHHRLNKPSSGHSCKMEGQNMAASGSSSNTDLNNYYEVIEEEPGNESPFSVKQETLESTSREPVDDEWYGVVEEEEEPVSVSVCDGAEGDNVPTGDTPPTQLTHEGTACNPSSQLVREGAEVDEKERRCDICNKLFSYRSAMLRHKRHVHFNIKPYECHHCHKCFPQSQNLKNHKCYNPKQILEKRVGCLTMDNHQGSLPKNKKILTGSPVAEKSK